MFDINHISGVAMNYNELQKALNNNGFTQYKEIDLNTCNYYHFTGYINTIEGSANVIAIIDNTLMPSLNRDSLRDLESIIYKNLYFSGYSNIHVLFLVYTDNINRDRLFADDSVKVWLADIFNLKLIIYENQPEDFCSLKASVESAIMSDLSYKTIKNINNKPFITIILAAINIIAYMIIEITGSSLDSDFMIKCGAAYSPLIYENHEYFRLITSMFLHFGVEHLANNMLSLILIGNELEKEIGHLRYLIIYFITGITASLASSYMYYSSSQNVVSAGASGAIMGISGALVILLLTNRQRINRSKGIRFFIVLILMINSGLNTSGIDNYAHIAGLITGAVIILISNLKKKGTNKHCI